MAKRHAFEELLEAEFRWPAEGDAPFAEAADPADNATISTDTLTRTVLMIDGYKRAADLMVEHAVSAVDRNSLVFPILFNYRQFIELSLKHQIASHGSHVGIEPIWNTHDLADLWGVFAEMLGRYANPDPDNADGVVRGTVIEFAKIDPGSYSSRYPVDNKGRPIEIAYGVLHLAGLADVMRGVAGYFDGTDAYLTRLHD